MAKSRLCPRAPRILPLIALLQIPATQAHPFVNPPFQNTSISTNSDNVQGPGQFGHGPPIPPPISDAETTSWPSTSWTAPPWQPTETIVQISDGQIQEPWGTYTEEMTSTSGNDVVVSTTTVTTSYASSSWRSSTSSWPESTSQSSSYSSASTTYSSVSSAIASSSSSSASFASYNSTSTSISSTQATSTSSSESTSTETITSTQTESSTTTETEGSTTTEAESATSVPDSSLTSLTTSAVQSATSTLTSSAVGSVHTSLETSGQPTTLPFPTSITSATSSLSLVDTSTLISAGPTATASVTTIQASDIFQPIETDAPPSQVPSQGGHPVPKLGIQEQSGALETNKFYANFFLGGQQAPTWTHPYSVYWGAGVGETGSWGLAVSHTERGQLANGTANSSLDAGEQAFFVNPVGIQSLVLSAAELGNGTSLTTDTLEAFSVNVNLVPQGAQSPVLTFPLVQGMAFVTGVYNSGTPLLESGVGILNLTYAGAVIDGTTYKYRATLGDGFDWLIYVSPANSDYSANSFTLLSTGAIQGPSGFGGYIQVAKVPAGVDDADSVYDAASGVYASAANITGSVSGTYGSYTLSWTKQGQTSRSLLMFALPHHVQSFASSTANGLTDVQLITTTKGLGTAVHADSWTLDEPNLPVDMSFAPWSPTLGSVKEVSSAAIEAINVAGFSELSQNISQQTNTGSLYYDGKALAKFAAICYTLNDIGGNATLAQTGLLQLEAAFATHVNNEMTFPLVYDTVWGGAVSDASYKTGDSGADFGNTYYNDHHFHYGYFVYSAAVIAYLDPAWLNQGTNKAWVNMLVRDYANSVTTDSYFPFSRMFDWYHGHSWAHGLFETFDGKDQESSSEDTMASYGMKMWGQIIGDTNMEARGNLMLAVQARSLQHYYLYDSNNTVEPPAYIGNKAAGIVFENKIDHTTYFGDVAAYIEGIHMLPLMPCSSLTRTTSFVQQEWDAYFSSSGISPASTADDGWYGILMANLAIIDAKTSYDFFSNSTGDFNVGLLDGGASQTWYLAWSAALGGSPASSSKERREAKYAIVQATAADERSEQADEEDKVGVVSGQGLGRFV